MNASTKTRSALRAALKQEDAALVERLATGAAGDGNPTAVADGPPADPAPKAKMRRRGAAAVGAEAAIKSETVVKPVKARKTTKTSGKAAGVASNGASPAPASPAVPVAAADSPAKPKRASKQASPIRPERASGEIKMRDQSAAAEAHDAKKDKREKVVRDSFSMPASEHRRIKALREQLGKAGRLTSKSEVLRAGLKLLGERGATELVTLLDSLSPVIKGKRKKH